MMHQAMTLYFLAKYFSLAQNHKEALIVSRGWRWIKEHFINGEKGLAIDWSWEPVPALPEYCNFRDTNSYFWILGLLPSLESLGVINKDESTTVADGIINYINNNLLEKDGKVPCVIPHEGPPEVLRNILPMFEQGVAWKGSFLADVIRQNF